MRLAVVIPTFRQAHRAIAAAQACKRLSLPNGLPPLVIVVDDGSGPSDLAALREAASGTFELVSLQNNAGRSVARNRGAWHADADIVVFLDSDCLPANDLFLISHAQALEQGAIASAGAVEGHGSGFWHRYQCEASERRARAHARGATHSGSSQNLAVRRADFIAIGGFDEDYRHYGFEDRDLLARLSLRGDVVWTGASVVRHMDDLTLPQVVAKMADAGCYNAAMFASRHPQAYRELGYAALDSRLHPWLRPLAAVAGPMSTATARILDRPISGNRLPYWLAKQTVRCIVAAAYLSGTSRA